MRDSFRQRLQGCSRLGWALAAVLGLFATSAWADEAANANGQTLASSIQHGMACWHRGNNLTTSGERWSEEELMAAHRSLPFGTRVRVINVKNGQATVVRITDRGPHTRKRIIDLSPAAARQIGLLEAGVMKVRVEILSDLVLPSTPAKPSV